MPGYLDIVAAMVKGYRQSIIFNVENENPEISAGLVKVYYNVLKTYLNEDGLKLTPRPAKAILQYVPENSGQSLENKFESAYRNEMFHWIFSNLLVCEEGFSIHLYNVKQMFDVLQVAVTDYRNALLFQLQKNRDPLAAMHLIRIMNILLPEEYRKEIPEPPSTTGKFTSQIKIDRQEWCLHCLEGIDSAIADYIQALRTLGSM